LLKLGILRRRNGWDTEKIYAGQVESLYNERSDGHQFGTGIVAMAPSRLMKKRIATFAKEFIA
jgi:hypothetical protein